ncbi:TlpA family protein disulfide reductase [Chitinophaga sp. G-6-1-13]|uniref:TlpA family protein disulfide reductase n=1 Tax=Chitinophaga fulva TaxID=2728842 RepID=A0A848GTD2_9BACT|nr:TlpA disulfide reductase family protein [Chitinophaga fulva]NML39993.1 TlpA family protein disulfide reductase [Chitinophaga fulva]
MSGVELREQLSQRIQARTATQKGRTVPLFKVPTNTGEIFTNESLKGTPYLIIFSATWCIPCHEDLPVIKSMYDKYKHKGMKVVAFNMDDDVKKWQQYITKEKLSWINVSERTKKWADSNIRRAFDIESVPTYLLIDQQEEIIYNSKGDENRLENLEHKLAKLFP